MTQNQRHEYGECHERARRTGLPVSASVQALPPGGPTLSGTVPGGTVQGKQCRGSGIGMVYSGFLDPCLRISGSDNERESTKVGVNYFVWYVPYGNRFSV